MRRIGILVPSGIGAERADRFLRMAIPDASPRSIRHAFDAGDVRREGRRLSKGDPVAGGQSLVVRALPDPEDWLPLPGELPGVRLLRRDDSVAVLEKPPGIPTEPIGVREPGTLAGHFLALFPETAAWWVDAGSPLLSRLDRETSGVVLAAMTESARASLLLQRGEASIRKRYVCRVAGRFEASAVLDRKIESRGGERVSVRRGVAEENPDYWTRVVPIEEGGGSSLVSAEIRKGKRHQIRAHLAAAGHPILGDAIYGPGGGGRLMLHALEVEFLHPATGSRTTVASGMPEGFRVPGD